MQVRVDFREHYKEDENGLDNDDAHKGSKVHDKEKDPDHNNIDNDVVDKGSKEHDKDDNNKTKLL